MEPEDPEERLAGLLGAMASPVRLRLVRRLQHAAFIPDLTEEFGLTRQALKKHLDELAAAGIIEATVRRRGALPATQYGTDATGFFALREMVADLGLSESNSKVARPTRLAHPSGAGREYRGRGLLMVHGDLAGRWFALEGKQSWVLGRDPSCEIAMPYDGYASGRHAALEARPDGIRLSDLHSTNGTRVNFGRLRRGSSVAVGHGDILTIGRTHLLLRDGR